MASFGRLPNRVSEKRGWVRDFERRRIQDGVKGRAQHHQRAGESRSAILAKLFRDRRDVRQPGPIQVERIHVTFEILNRRQSSIVRKFVDFGVTVGEI